MKENKFEIGIEILRCVCMFMILILHYFRHGGVLDNIKYGSILYYYVWSLEGVCYIAVNCYMLISGYLLSTRNFSFNRIFNLYVEILFYCLLLSVITFSIGLQSLSIKNILQCFPLVSRNNWYVTVYFAISFLMPFFNKFINSVDEYIFQSLILVGLVMFSLIPTVFFWVDQFNVNGGYSLLWYIYLYFVGAFIRKYKGNLFFCIKEYKIFMFLSILLLPLIKFILELLKINSIAGVLYSYNSVPVFISSVAFITFFVNINIKNIYLKNIIMYFSRATFAIFYIHTYFFMKKIIWIQLGVNRVYNSLLLIPHCIFVVLFLFIFLTFVDHVRIFIFSKIYINKYINLIADELNNKIKSIC